MTTVYTVGNCDSGVSQGQICITAMSTRLSDVAQRALSAISSAQNKQLWEADDFVSRVTRTFRAAQSRHAPRAQGMRLILWVA